MTRFGLLSFGTITVDYAKIIDQYPDLEGIAIIQGISQSCGGPALNICFDIRQLDPGIPVELVSAIGVDEAGDFVLAQCEEFDVVSKNIKRYSGSKTGFTDAMLVEGDARRTFFFHRGSCDDLTSEFLPIETSNASIFHIGAPGLHQKLDSNSGWFDALRRARQQGMHTNMELVQLNESELKNATKNLFPELDSVIINEVEAGRLTGIDETVVSIEQAVDWTKIETMGVRLLEFGVRKFVVVHTPAGAVCVDREMNIFRQGSVLVGRNEIKSTSGAGDAFAAGMLYGVMTNLSLPKSLEMAVANAAWNIQQVGTSVGMAGAEEVLMNARHRGFRQIL